ncbi:hypothetical protein NLJ89_g354 [Agrocybe chaxingu]|uniref:Autophagy-related protein 4 n=1 Tax=Agrocybe chaxingu TaxID=84603 RepID=A0A9W8N221_9AGAR|nr:hypothetical protein NLJ89_g354 [Agrocybe chaxingu]
MHHPNYPSSSRSKTAIVQSQSQILVRVTSSLASGSSASASPEPTSSKPKKGSKFLSISKDNHRKSTDVPPPQESQETDEPPVIVEPISIPRPRTRSERPAAPSSSSHIPTPSLYASTSSTSRIGDLPTRLSGWFTHTFSTSSTDLSLPTLLAQHSAPPSSAAMSSPKGKSNALLTAAKHGKGHLDKAMRYLLDSDAVPDKCTDPIWLLGVQHPGYEEGASSTVHNAHHGGRRTSISPHPPSSPPSFRSSTSSVLSTATTDSAVSLSQSTSTARHSSSKEYRDPSANWPPAFYLDFTSRIWLTYRSHFGSPIKDSRLGDLEVPCLLPEPPSTAWDPSLSTSSAKGGTPSSPTGTPVTTLLKRPWGWGGEKTWNSDSGWGCMLRTGQSLLANALLSVKLGRDWRCPPHPIVTADYATYVQILTWFLDTPNPEAPFSVHRMALAGKELGTDVGQWFGPSVAAGAIRTLVNSFPDCGLAVSVAIDSTLYRTEVYAASHGEASTSRSPRRRHTTAWGDRPVLLLLGIRLGIEGVNPIYYETIKQLYTFPQSVGIAGGRPSSSYYFVGSQADNLFYLDPHNTRSAIPLRPPPPQAIIAVQSMREQMAFVGAGDENYAEVDSGSDADREREKERKEKRRKAASTNNGSNTNSTILGASINTTQRTATPTHQRTRTPTSPSSVRTGSSNFSYHAPVSPSPLQHQFSNSSADSSGDASFDQSYEYDYSVEEYSGIAPSAKHSHSRSPPPSYPGPGSHGRWRSSSANHTPAMSPSNSEMDHRELGMFGGSGSRGSTNNSLSTSNSNSTSNSFGTSARTGESGSGLDPVQLHYCTAYSAAELKTFHCERVRKMPLSGLDPSMLIGFLCRDEADWWDFKRRVGELPRTIFSVQEEPPTWPSDSDDNMGLESISEPDDIDLDEDGVEVDGRGEGDESENEDNDDGDNEQFFDTQSSGAGSGQERSERGRSDVDTEEDSVDPVTPGPGSRFDVPPPPMNVGRKGQAEDEEDKGIEFGPEDGEGFEDEGNDIEDDWIDPSLPTPTLSGPSSSLKDHRPLPPQPTPVPTKDPSPSPPSSSNVPPLAKGKSSSSSKHASSSGSGKRLKKTHKQIPVPVPAVRLHSHYQQQQQEHYPFPVTTADDGTVSPNGEKNRSRSSSTKGGVSVGGKRMHTARARDGGRTQSGGVKGILTDE